MIDIEVLCADVQREIDSLAVGSPRVAVCRIVLRVPGLSREYTVFAQVPGDSEEGDERPAFGLPMEREGDGALAFDEHDALVDALVAASGETTDVIPGEPAIYSANPTVHLIAYNADERLGAIATAVLAKTR